MIVQARILYVREHPLPFLMVVIQQTVLEHNLLVVVPIAVVLYRVEVARKQKPIAFVVLFPKLEPVTPNPARPDTRK